MGAVDALIDIVGGIEGFEQLGITRIYQPPGGLGSGWVRAAHGVMPVPAPATAILLEGLEVGPVGPVTGEATTPTGAVLLRVLSCRRASRPLAASSMAGAWGAGGRNPKDYPNALRLILRRVRSRPEKWSCCPPTWTILSPEFLEPLREALFMAGALDVQVWATQMKKGTDWIPSGSYRAPARPTASRRPCSGTVPPPEFVATVRSGSRWPGAKCK